jgi:hypothetical protein
MGWVELPTLQRCRDGVRRRQQRQRRRRHRLEHLALLATIPTTVAPSSQRANGSYAQIGRLRLVHFTSAGDRPETPEPERAPGPTRAARPASRATGLVSTPSVRRLSYPSAAGPPPQGVSPCAAKTLSAEGLARYVRTRFAFIGVDSRGLFCILQLGLSSPDHGRVHSPRRFAPT